MTPETIAELQKEAHEIAVKSGWWDCQECRGSGQDLLESCIPKGVVDASHNCSTHQCFACHGTGRAPVDIPERIALLHSELSEALEEYRSGAPITQIVVPKYGREFNDCASVIASGFLGEKIEGFGIELADFVIRLMDLAGGLGYNIQNSTRIRAAFKDFIAALPLTYWIAKMHEFVSTSWGSEEDGEIEIDSCDDLYWLISHTDDFCAKHGIDLEACSRLKMAYNRTREYRYSKVC